MVHPEKEQVAGFEGSHLQDVEVPFIVLPESMLSPCEAEVCQHAVAEDIGGIALACGAPAAGYELFWSLPPTATPYRQQTVQGSGLSITIPYLIMVVTTINYLRETVITTVITCQYTVQTVVTDRKLRCQPLLDNDHI